MFTAIFGQTSIGFKEGYNLVWADEFQDSAYTYQAWDKFFPWGPWTGGYHHYDQPGNRYIDSGYAKLVVLDTTVNGIVYNWDDNGDWNPYYRDFDYSAGMFYSKRGFLFGIFETKFRSDEGKGLHNAFWLYGQESQEIDVFEFFGSKPHEVQQNLIWKERDPLTGSSQSASFKSASPNFTEAFHTIGVKWTADNVLFYLDGEDIIPNAFTDFIRKRHVPDLPMHVIINNAISGFDGEPNAQTKFPSNIWFDYVRVYQNDTVVRAPVILAQLPKEYANYLPFDIELSEVLVSDYYQTYPIGFQMQFLPGDNYTVVNGQIQIDSGFLEDVHVNIQVNDGINLSEVFQFLVTPADVVDVVEEQLVEAVILEKEGSVLRLLHEQIGKSTQVILFDASGKELNIAQVGRGEATLDMSQIPIGNYLIYVLNNNEVLYSKALQWKP